MTVEINLQGTRMPWKDKEFRKAYMKKYVRKHRKRLHKQAQVRKSKLQTANPELYNQRVSRKKFTNQEWYYENKHRFKEYKKQQSCTICGESDSRCLDFHHKDPVTKSFHVSTLCNTRAWSTIYAEIIKCIILCSNCHRKLHCKNEDE